MTSCSLRRPLFWASNSAFTSARQSYFLQWNGHFSNYVTASLRAPFEASRWADRSNPSFHVVTSNMATSDSLVTAAKRLRDAVAELRFAAPVTHVYNPLIYAWRAHEMYLRRYGNGRKRVHFMRTPGVDQRVVRSEEHTSELQSRPHLVC